MCAFPRRSRAFLRACAAVLTVLATAAPVAAQKGVNGSGGPSAGPDRGHQAPTDATPALPGTDTHALVAALRFASEGTLVIDGGRIDAPSPWSRYLAAGMWLRLEGSWEGATFRVERLDIASPAYFSYYLGPASPLALGTGWVEAWFAADTPEGPAAALTVRRTVRDGAPRALVRAVGGAWAALPAGLVPPPQEADGWILFTGRSDGDAVRWTSSRPFP